MISYSLCERHNKMANLLTSGLLEPKQQTLKKEQYFSYQISDQPISKRTALLRFLPTGVYLDKIKTVFVKLPY